MKSSDAIAVLSALAQSTRLKETFRLLVRHEPDGLPAGELARSLDIPQNTMSAHAGEHSPGPDLSRVGGRARSIIYRAKLDRLRDVTLFLLKDCCGGDADLCAPIIAALNPCCAPVARPHG